MKQFALLCMLVMAFMLFLSTETQADLVHQYNFNSDANDSVGTAHGTLVNNTYSASYTSGKLVLGNDGTQRSGDITGGDTSGDYVDLPNGTISALGSQATFETWFTFDGGGYYQRIFDFGTSDAGEDISTGGPSHKQIMLIPKANYSRLAFYLHDDSDDSLHAVFADAILEEGVENHIAVTWDGANDRATVYLNGASIGCMSELRFSSLASLTDNNNWLGRSQWNDIMLVGGVNEFRIYNEALTSSQLYKNCQDGPDAAFTRVNSVTPAKLSAAPVHRYSFNSDCSDSIGTADGLLINNTGNTTFSGGKLILGNDGTQRSGDLSGDTSGDYIDLPNNLISGLADNATFEFWVTSNSAPGTIWERIFDFGTSQGGEDISDSGAGCSSVLGIARSAENILRFGHREGTTDTTSYVSSPSSMEEGVETHVVCVWDGDNDQMKLYVDGEFMTANDTLFDLGELIDNNNWLGRAQYNDLMFEGSYNEFRIYDYALTAEEVLGNFQAGANLINKNCGLPGDADEDGDVDEDDATRLAQNWGATELISPYTSMWQMGDFNNSGTVDAADASILAAQWGATIESETTVPEPSALIMALCGLIALVGCRRAH